jgi:hypothetical protein
MSVPALCAGTFGANFVKRQKAKGKRQKAKGKRQKAKGVDAGLATKKWTFG